MLDPEEEGWVRRSDWGVWPKERKFPVFKHVLLSIDPAYTEDSYDKKRMENDPTGASVWGLFDLLTGDGLEQHVMLLRAWEKWLGFPDLVETIKLERLMPYGSKAALAQEGRRIDTILIEEKASGKSLRQQLKREGVDTRGYNPNKDSKLQRLHYISGMYPAGRVWMQEERSEAEEHLVSQVCSYIGEGSTERDDLLDTTTQGIRFLMDNYIGALTVNYVEHVPPRVKREGEGIYG